MMQLSSTDKILVFFVIINVAHSLLHDLPPYFPKCRRSDPKLNECLLNATEQVRPFLTKGVPELGIPPIEPFIIPEASLEQDSQVLNFKALLKNIRVTGLSSYKFSQFDFDVPNLQWFCKATIGNLHLEGDYSVVGRVLLAPIRGKGKFVAGITNSNVTAHVKTDVVKKKGVDYLHPATTKTIVEVGGPKIHLDGLFDGNEELNRVINNIISDNVDELFDDLKPVVEQAIVNIVDEWLFRYIEDRVPFNKLYPKE